MLNNADNQTIDNLAADASVALGNGANDTITNHSTGDDTISVGQGNGDLIVDWTGSFDTLTMGNGIHDVLGLVYGDHNTATLGSGANDGVGIYVGGYDTVTLGNGAGDGVGIYGGGGDTVTLGNGAGDVVGDVLGAGGDFITLGNGDGDIVYAAAGAGVRDTIALGQGAGDTAIIDDIGPYHGLATISFGGLGATLDLTYDVIPSFAPPTSVAQASVSTAALSVVQGLTAGDTIVLAGAGYGIHDALLAGPAANLAGVAGEAAFAPGVYDAAAKTFTFSAAGHDALLTYDNGGFASADGFVSVVLVGAAHDIAGSTIANGVIALG